MRISPFSWLLFILLLIVILYGAEVFSVSGQCQPDQQALLLQLKNSLEFDTSFSTKLVTWNNSTDCCSWRGVNCTDGRVTGLDLSTEWITSGINGSSSLFQLQYLERLNLAINRINYTLMPPEFGKLANLSYLNLSNAGFAGQIPGAISRLRRLFILDLSTPYFLWLGADSQLKLENPNLRMFVQNLSELTELYLDGVRISAQGKEWCQALSSSLLKLRVLSLSNCNLSGPIDSSILGLSHLSVIRLDYNNLSTANLALFANFSSLTSLRLTSSSLSGEIPGGIFQLPMLQTLDLSSNELLQGSLPDFPLNRSLQTLILSSTNASGGIPDSIGNLKMLSTVRLSNCSLSGQIPRSIAGLKELAHLDLSSNQLTGTIPSLGNSTNLAEVILSYNNLTGQVPMQWEGLNRLEILDLRYNQLKGTVPSSLFSLPSLRKIQLSNNQLSGTLEVSNVSSPPLETLDLSSNKLEGLIPTSVFELQGLKSLSLSYNNLTGHLQLGLAQQLKNLSSLDLSYNRLFVNATVPESSFPLLSTLKLASCKLMAIPEFLRGQSRLTYLDLSNNQINGQIRNWLWRLGSLQYLNLSRNHLVSIEEPQLAPVMLNVIDVHKNLLQGQIPHITTFATYLDFSENNFSSTIPDHIGDVLGFTYYFSLSDNKLSGSIPSSICKATYLHVLDLSNNSLSGEIPKCLTKMAENLGVLNLRRNNFGGIIPDTFPESCKLQTLDLSGNLFRGKVPNSLASCIDLEVVNLGKNLINDSFPCQLKAISRLRVLVLRSNQFSGPIGCDEPIGNWPMLQIVDLALNNFNGSLAEDKLRNWKAMMSRDVEQSHLKHLQFAVLQLSGLYYQDTITITSKGLEMELVKILTVFTSIDLSCNNLEGQIPDVVGKFNALYILNLSHNALSGPIPQSLGNVSQLESLDLSSNKLTGRIPIELANLNFLSFLNLSNNSLEGSIPTSTQLQSFPERSFENNEGLCGPPLKTKCPKSPSELPPAPRRAESKIGLNWQFILTGLGFGVGAAAVVAPATFCERFSRSLNNSIDKILLKIFPPVVFIYTSSDHENVEVEENLEENNSDESENDDDDDDDEKDDKFCVRYCVFCSKLDMSMKMAIHDSKCTCHDLSTVSSSSSAPSSQSS